MRLLVYTISLLFIISACTNRGELTPEETGAAEAKGKEIAMASFKALSTHLGAAMKEGGPMNAVEFCSSKAQTTMDSISNAFGVKARRASLKYRNEIDKAEKHELVILQEFEEAFQKGKKIQPTVRLINNETIGVYIPIYINTPLCLNCHGENIDTELERVILASYPNDKATGYKLNDLRGMWSIAIPR